MKKISELKLETIQLEDQVLLVEKNREYQTNGWAFNTGKGVFWVDMSDRYPSGYKFIASTKPLEELPLLVIDYEIIGKPLDDYIKTKANQDQCIGFIEGYNKAKETFKFTEDDIWYIVDLFIKKVPDAIDVKKEIQSLAKKELWIEVEEWSLAENVEAKNQNIPKIINNQIKAVWK